MSYQVRDPIENDEDRLAMKSGNMPPPFTQRVANPRIREDQALQEFHSTSDKIPGATSDDYFPQAWFDYGRSVFTQSVKKTGTNVELFNVPTYQCRILFNNMVPSTGRMTREPEQAYCQRREVQHHRFVTSPGILGK